MRAALKPRIPIVAWLSNYDPRWLKLDVVAGLSAAAVVIPKSMAYATIAGLPVEVGLYTALVPTIVYAILGTAQTLSVSTTSTIAILVAADTAGVGSGGDVQVQLHVAATLALLVGIFLTAGAALRLGFLADFISDPVLVGFKAAIAVVIILDQLPKLLGLHIGKVGFLRDLVAIATHLPQSHLATLAVGCVAIALLAMLDRFVPRVPNVFVVVALGIAASALFGFSHHGVAILGPVPSGFPMFAMPDSRFVGALWPGALGIALMSFTESIAAGRAFARAQQHPDPNQEMAALGLANLAGSFFQSMPAGGGTSQTAENARAGARTQLAQLVTVLGVIATLLFLSPVIALLPLTVLAAVIVMSSIPMINVRDFNAILKIRATEFWWAVTSFVGVIFLGTLNGILVAIALSLLSLMYYANHPPLYVLARKPGTDVFRPIDDEHPGDERFPGLLILRTEGGMTFASVPRLKDKMQHAIADASPRVILLDLSGVSNIEYSALRILTEFEEKHRSLGREVWLAGLTPNVLEIVRRAPLGKTLGEGRLFFNVTVAVASYESRPL